MYVTKGRFLFFLFLLRYTPPMNYNRSDYLNNYTNSFNDSSTFFFFFNCKFPSLRSSICTIQTEKKKRKKVNTSKLPNPRFNYPTNLLLSYSLSSTLLSPFSNFILLHNPLSHPPSFLHNRVGAFNPKDWPPAAPRSFVLFFVMRATKNSRHPTLIPLPSIKLKRTRLIIYKPLKKFR